MENSLQIKHEAEYTRQHARFKIPATLIVDHQSYPIKDWSVSGVSVSDVPEEIGNQLVHQAAIEFDFSVFKLTAPVEIEVVRHDPETHVLACRFSNLEKNTLLLFHYVINAFLAGEVVTAGDLIHIVSREGFTKENLDKRLQTESGGFRRFLSSVWRWFGHLILFSIFAILTAFLIFTAYKRLYVVDANMAIVTAPQTTVVRAPGDGIFSPAAAMQSGDVLAKGDTLGMLRFTTGGTMMIASPCDCIIIDSHLSNGGFFAKGDPLFSFIPSDFRLHVTADLMPHDVRKLVIGQRTEVRFINGNTYDGHVMDLKAGKPGLVSVVVETEQPLPLEMLHMVAQVRIYTLNLSLPF